MRSFQVCRCGEPLQMVERATPAPTGTQVLLKVIAAGVCHSDIHIWDGFYELGQGKKLDLLQRGIKLPLTMGHENVGEVVAVGPETKGVKLGARMLAHPWIGCGECAICKTGEEQLCKTPRNLGVFSDGGYSDFVMLPHPRYLFDIGDLDPARAAPLACSGITTFGALKKAGAIIKDEPLVIIGAGGLGLMCLALNTMMDNKPAIVVDIDPVKRDAAMKAGALAVVDGGAADAVQQIIKLTNGGAWAVIDYVGASKTVQLGVDSITKGGRVIVVGLFGGDITVSTPFFPLRAMAIQGSYVGSLPEMKELLDLVRAKGLPPVPLKTRRLEEVGGVLDELRAGKVVGRVVLTPA
ncbi:MAG TPA: alcohol dehydrogenase [Pseudolabrys sp.]|nr:alcohol dehydrogenase [Pseudolabrys sp.]